MILWLTAFVSSIASLLSALAADILLGDRIPLLGDFAGLFYIRNPGVAFGIDLPSIVEPIVIGIALVCVIVFAVRSKTRISQFGFGLIIGGAFANIVDRLHDGFVTDFFQVSRFPIFNVADSCITIGVVLLLIEALIDSRKNLA